MNHVTHTTIVNFIWDYRLIADVVTDQVDVRGIAVPETADELDALDDEEKEDSI